MILNRSIPRATVIPVLAYFDANEAAAWLCMAFAFTVRLRVDTHRVQLNVGEGAVIVRELRPHEIGGYSRTWPFGHRPDRRRRCPLQSR